MITPTEARERVEMIRAIANDDEAAHGAEDQLRQDVLQAIAEGTRHSRALAEIALTTDEIRFARWCA